MQLQIKMVEEALKAHDLYVRTNGLMGRRVDFSNFDLRFASLEGSNLATLDLSYSNLCDANLKGANLMFANLQGAKLNNANLSGAELGGAVLWGARGDGRVIRSKQISRYKLVYTKDIVWIGCQAHTIDKWEAFNDETIGEMAIHALSWWREHKQKVIDTVRNTKWD